MADKKLVVFVKAPRPGLVKTRLAQTLGTEAACLAYRRLVAALLGNLSGLPEIELRFSPDDAQTEIQPWLRLGWSCSPQGEGDLGYRLQKAFADAFSSGAERIAIIGSDCPAISAEDIREGWARLKTHDLVLGPATDGGYWLIGLRQPQPQLFESITWSSEKVLAETMQRASEAGLRTHLLRELTDVDTERDWREFLGHS